MHDASPILRAFVRGHCQDDRQLRAAFLLIESNWECPASALASLMGCDRSSASRWRQRLCTAIGRAADAECADFGVPVKAWASAAFVAIDTSKDPMDDPREQIGEEWG